MKVEHMIFERAGQADLTVVLIDDHVVTKKVGRALPPDIFAFSLPLATGGADQGIERPRSTRMRLGMSICSAHPNTRCPIPSRDSPPNTGFMKQTGTDRSHALTRGFIQASLSPAIARPLERSPAKQARRGPITGHSCTQQGRSGSRASPSAIAVGLSISGMPR
jgi:hypothetical protein